MSWSSATGRRIRRALVVCALIAGIAVMHHVGKAIPGLEAAPATAVAAAVGHILVDPAVASTGGGHNHPGAESAQTGGAAAIAASAPPAGQGAGHDAGHGTTGASHDLLHLCLAVVVSAALALLGWWLARRAAPRRIVGRWNGVRRWPPLVRPPRVLTGRLVLLSVCVMRT